MTWQNGDREDHTKTTRKCGKLYKESFLILKQKKDWERERERMCKQVRWNLRMAKQKKSSSSLQYLEKRERQKEREEEDFCMTFYILEKAAFRFSTHDTTIRRKIFICAKFQAKRKKAQEITRITKFNFLKSELFLALT